jgi:hypothetical protein
MKIASKLLSLSGALLLGAAPFMVQAQGALPAPNEPIAQIDVSIAPRLQGLGQDMRDLSPEARLTELQAIAKVTLAEGRPMIFRDIVVAFFDPHWSELDRGNTALALIGWLPDTAEFLNPRILATSIAIEEGKLDAEEQDMLWRDLRARVERVGDFRLTDTLLIAMAQSGAVAQLTQTIFRLYDTEVERLDTLITLLHEHGRDAPQNVTAALVREIDALTQDKLVQRHDPNRLAVALFRAGHVKRAEALLAQEQDPVLRMRTRMTFLLDDPEYNTASAEPALTYETQYPKIGPQ